MKQPHPMRLRPHHILDIVSSHGHGQEFRPHPYGHAVHTVAHAILANTELSIQLVVGADEICRPCRHLGANGLCDDVLGQLDPPPSKQEYNDGLDRRLLKRFGLAQDAVMTVREYLEVVNRHVPGLEQTCTHPKEDPTRRLDGLTRGLRKLGVGAAQGTRA